MRRIASTVLLSAAAGVLLGMLAPAPAEATTCRSACSQNRRACNSVAKAVYKGNRLVCKDERDACHELCDLTPTPGCDDTCRAARGSCKDLAKMDRGVARATCTTSRTTCNEICVDPVDGVCVKNCKADRRVCARAAKTTETQCKRACANGPDRLFGGGLPLGLFDWAEYVVHRRAVDADDVLVVYTDGVTEAANEQEEEFSDERLARGIASHRGGSSADISAAILDAIASHAGSSQAQVDDVTLMVLRVRETRG